MTLPRWDELPDYEHVRWCRYGHIQKCCPAGCNGEPVDYPEYESAEFTSRWSR